MASSSMWRTSSSSLMDSGPDKARRYEESSKDFTIEEILYVIYTLANTIDFIKKSNLAKIPLEAAIIKLSLSSPIVPLAQIIDRIDRLDSLQKPETNQPSPAVEESKADRAIVKETPKRETKKTDSSPDMDEILSAWATVINYVKAKRISIGSYLQEGYPIAVDAKALTIGFPREFQFHKDVLDSPENRRLIEEALEALLKTERKVIITLVEPAEMRRPLEDQYGGKGASEETIEKGAEPDKEVDPIVKSALDIFSGEIANRNTERGHPR